MKLIEHPTLGEQAFEQILNAPDMGDIQEFLTRWENIGDSREFSIGKFTIVHGDDDTEKTHTFFTVDDYKAWFKITGNRSSWDETELDGIETIESVPAYEYYDDESYTRKQRPKLRL
jgi:hypothetical protein